MEADEKYWEEKIVAIVELSKKFGFPEQNAEFWNRQPAGVISLVIKIYHSAIFDEL